MLEATIAKTIQCDYIKLYLRLHISTIVHNDIALLMVCQQTMIFNQCNIFFHDETVCLL
jgi:hypothetical protein